MEQEWAAYSFNYPLVIFILYTEFWFKLSKFRLFQILYLFSHHHHNHHHHHHHHHVNCQLCCYEMIKIEQKKLNLFLFYHFTCLKQRKSCKIDFFWLLLKTFFNCYLAVPRSTLDHYCGGSFTHLMLITEFIRIWHEGHW